MFVAASKFVNINFPIPVVYRKPASGTTSKKAMPGGGSGGAGMWKFYSEDSPGIKV